MARGIILIRHAMPEVVRGVASQLWELGDSGREDCVLLAHHLPRGLASTAWSSAEPKARQTAEVVAIRRGLTVQVDARFGEVDRPTTWDGDYRERAAHYLATGEGEGWEPREAVVRRFTAAIADALVCSGGDGDLVVVDHGLALSLYVASCSPVDSIPFWRALTFPDAWRLDTATGALEQVFSGGAPPR
jgi:broad specificity phosphatase PhoE